MQEFESSKIFLMIPATPTYDKELLKTPKALLLLGEIVSFLNTTGEFYMSNKKICERWGVSRDTLSRYLTMLEKKHLIQRTVIRNEKNEVVGRKITAGLALNQSFTAPNFKANGGASVQSTSPVCVQGTSPVRVQGTSPAQTRDILEKSIREVDKNNKKHTKKRTTKSGSARVSEKNKSKKLEKQFDEIWKNYPKKIGKQRALKFYIAWKKEDSKHSDDYLIKKIGDYKKYLDYNHTEERYIKHGDTWFSQRCFEDDYSVAEKTSTNEPVDYGYDSLLSNVPPSINQTPPDNMPF